MAPSVEPLATGRACLFPFAPAHRTSRCVAEQANWLVSFDGVIHNVGIGYREPRRIATEVGLPTSTDGILRDYGQVRIGVFQERLGGGEVLQKLGGTLG
jgi:hypothetical protein